MELMVRDLSFSYEGQSILKEVSFSLEKGKIGALIGASGSGKSTLFKILTGLLSPPSGEVEIHGCLSPLGCQYISYMMQQDLLLPWRTVLGNVLLTAELGKSEIDPQVHGLAVDLLREVGLASYKDRYPDELSGGMRQRVSLARALLQQRPILLLDEPFGSLDVGRREQMYRLLQHIREKHKTTMLMVTHDFRDALSLSDHLFLLAQGKIYKEWSIPVSMRSDLYQMGQLQQELHALLIETSLGIV